jgi:hypothetical protein
VSGVELPEREQHQILRLPEFHFSARVDVELVGLHEADFGPGQNNDGSTPSKITLAARPVARSRSCAFHRDATSSASYLPTRSTSRGKFGVLEDAAPTFTVPKRFDGEVIAQGVDHRRLQRRRAIGRGLQLGKKAVRALDGPVDARHPQRVPEAEILAGDGVSHHRADIRIVRPVAEHVEAQNPPAERVAQAPVEKNVPYGVTRSSSCATSAMTLVQFPGPG